MNTQELERKVKELFWKYYDGWATYYNPVTDEPMNKAVMSENTFI